MQKINLNKFLDYQPGWDGYDAEPPNKLSVRNCQYFLDTFAYNQCAVGPSVAGGMGVTFDNSYIEFSNEGTISHIYIECSLDDVTSWKSLEHFLNDSFKNMIVKEIE